MLYEKKTRERQTENKRKKKGNAKRQQNIRIHTNDLLSVCDEVPI